MTANTAQSNRAQMPQVTAVVDAFRAEFPDCKVTYASENGIVRGTPWPIETPNVFECLACYPKLCHCENREAQ